MAQQSSQPVAPVELAAKKAVRPASVARRRWRKFRSLKRGWYSFLLLTSLFVLSWFNPLLVNNRALVVSYEGSWYFPVFAGHYEAVEFGQRRVGEANYRQLKTLLAEEGSGWVLLPPIPYDPTENLLRELEGNPPHSPSWDHWMGTDDRGRDVFARLVYGFRISMIFGLAVVFCSYVIGVTIGAILGFFGGWVDIVGQRFVEIWGAMPFLYTVIILSSLFQPGLFVLIPLLAIFRWVGMSYYIRGEFYREKAKDYVAASIAIGESRWSIMFKQLLPNALTPIVSFGPFAFVAAISSLVSLDFLGFGLQPPTPSWGELIRQAYANGFTSWHLVFFPLGAIFLTLIMAVFIGEAIREAFDPRRFSRLR